LRRNPFPSLISASAVVSENMLASTEVSFHLLAKISPKGEQRVCEKISSFDWMKKFIPVAIVAIRVGGDFLFP
jgi:hypothetical protein